METAQVETIKNSWEELLSQGLELREQEDNGRWSLGDLSLTVETQYGEDSIGKFAYGIGLGKKTLMSYRTVASVFTPEIRKQYHKLSFSHFKTVAALEKPEAWLEKADDNDWSVETLIKEVKVAYEGLSAPAIVDKPPKVYRCPECNQWRLENMSSFDICKGHYKLERNKVVYK
jgi:hypothetical protein